MKHSIKKERGITLVALIITIIILILLATIAIKIGIEYNIINLAFEKTENFAEAEVKEQEEIEHVDKLLKDTISKITNSVDYKPNATPDILNINNNGLMGKIAKINKSGYHEVTVQGKIGEEASEEKYNIHTIVYNGDLILDGKKEVEGAVLTDNIYEFGDETKDVATSDEYAQNMVVLKVKGNLIIEEDVKLTACKSPDGYGGPLRNDNIL